MKCFLRNNISSGPENGERLNVYTYNSFGEIATYTASVNSTPVYSYQLTHDKLGRITQKIETISGVTTTYDYQYDFNSNLTQVSTNGTVASTYQYDSNGNRIGGSVNGVTISATYDDQDKLKTYGTDNYTYSVNGELSQKISSLTGQTTSYQYNVLGNLTQVTNGTQTVAYDLDMLMNRHNKKVNGTITEIFGYDQFGKLRATFNSSTQTKQFVYASKQWSPDYFYDETNSHEKYRIVTDYLGSPRLVIKVSDGTIVQTMKHDEFGRVIQDTSPGYQPFGFAGGMYDPDTKLVRFQARSYDAETGRWTSKDPILFGGGDANLMSYVANDPVNFIDPEGLYKFAPGAKGPLSPQLDTAMQCFDSCTGRNTVITSGRDSHKSSDPHMRGEACDVGRNSNPDLTQPNAKQCFEQCFTSQARGQEEQNGGPGTHFHFQLGPDLGGNTGFRLDVAPHGR